jgi:hypothetical protein
MSFPEFRAFLRRTHEGGSPRAAHEGPEDEGAAAFADGAGPADNPYSFDTAEHLAWESGWFEALDEAEEHEK